MSNPTSKKTKATTVFELIRADILNGKFPPNERLQMDDLKARYAVGYSPLREALCKLASSGLVDSKEQCGFHVAPLSVEELYDLYQIRLLIENMALELSIDRGCEGWEANVLAAWHKYGKFLKSKEFDPNKWGALQREFRNSLVAGCNSVWLMKIRDLLHEQAIRYRNLCLNSQFKNKKVLNNFYNENEKLVAAVLKRNKNEAIKLSEKTWLDSVKIIADVLRSQLDK